MFFIPFIARLTKKERGHMKFDENRISLDASNHLDIFKKYVQDIPYEHKGILFSEMYFMWLCAKQYSPKRILESGRARAQSTAILSRAFPESQVISVEHDPNSPDVPIATARLANCPNVQALFGDSTKIFPKIVQIGDVALIDGPKGFRGVRLALSLLATNKVSVVFIHDVGSNNPEHVFLKRIFPEALFSDDARFARMTCQLDQDILESIPSLHRSFLSNYGYGLACIPWQPKRHYWIAHLEAILAGVFNRFF